MHKIGFSCGDEMLRVLMKEKERRQCSSVPEVIRILVYEALMSGKPLAPIAPQQKKSAPARRSPI